jgi:uncharacterized protein (DUF1697 family)
MRVTRYAGLLRAVNVGGNKLAMPELRRLVERLGGRDVETYLQSGNVVFTGPASVGAALERALAEELGVTSTVLLRSHAQLAKVVAGNPFGVADKTVSVTFLAGKPARAKLDAIDPGRFGDDRFSVVGSAIYLHTPGGYGRSKLSNAFWEKALATAATTRNWNTVVALTDLTG